MEELKYISFDTEDVNLGKDYVGNDIEGSFIDIKIGSKDFSVFISNKESEKNNKLYECLGNNQYDLVEVIFGLKKLTKFLELSVDIGFSKSLVE